MPQLQINQGPQDALLYDNSKSYFKQIGYSRTSNFQIEYRDVDAANNAALGATLQFVMPKCADLLGPVDLVLNFEQLKDDVVTALAQSTTDSSGASPVTTQHKAVYGWVESLGYAMIDHMTFSIGSHECERISGDQLYIINELMKSDEQRVSAAHIGKTGRPLVEFELGYDGSAHYCKPLGLKTNDPDSHRLLCRSISGTTGTEQTNDAAYPGKKLIVPLSFFFTKAPSQYFPMCAVAGSHDVRIQIKLRPLNELLVIKPIYDASEITSALTSNLKVSGFKGGAIAKAPKPIKEVAIEKCQLRCTYVHVTGPEAADLMNAEQVRLMRLWMNHSKVIAKAASTTTSPEILFDMELPFLHPIQELVIVIRKVSELTNATDTTAGPTEKDQGTFAKNRFAFHGGGKDPNIESLLNCTFDGAAGNWQLANRTDTSAPSVSNSYLEVDSFKLSLNGQERHPSLAADGLDRRYLMEKVLPALHSNTSTKYGQCISRHRETVEPATSTTHTAGRDYGVGDLKHLEQMHDRKEIYVYPFCVNPEGANPSGAVNFSKVSHAKLQILGKVKGDAVADTQWQCDVFGVYFNWLSIKDGRAVTSFA